MSEFGPRPESVSHDRAGGTPEGGSIRPELRPGDVVAQCMLGNGECPQTCRLYRPSLDLTLRFGADFMREKSRELIVFGEGFDQRMDLSTTASIMSLCETEKPPVE